MTANQLQYWRNVETERSNRANEYEKQRSNRMQEQTIPYQISNLMAQAIANNAKANLDTATTELRNQEAQKAFYDAVQAMYDTQVREKALPGELWDATRIGKKGDMGDTGASFFSGLDIVSNFINSTVLGQFINGLFGGLGKK